MKPSYWNNRAFLKKINALPTQGAGWTCDIITSTGNKFDDGGELLPPEKLKLWRRDPVECVMELLGNPAFKNYIKCTPERKYQDAEGKIRIFDEMWTVDWWWDTQVLLTSLGIYLMLTKCQKRLPIGSTIAALILSSDKTQLTQFRGDKSAWPVYLTLGNISKSKHQSTCNNINWISTCGETQQLHRWNLLTPRLQTLPLLHEFAVGTSCWSRKEGCWYCLCRWVHSKGFPHTRSVCRRFSWTMFGGLLQGKLLPKVSGAASRARRLGPVVVPWARVN